MVARLTFLLFLAVAHAKVWNDHISHDSGSWTYITKFAYEGDCQRANESTSETCPFTFKFTPQMVNGQLTEGLVMLYDDDTFPAAYHAKSCFDKVQMAKPVKGTSAFKWGPNPGEITVDVHETQRPHWWFVAIGNCTGPVKVDVTLTFKNHGSQFGFDEMGLLPTYITFLVVQTLIAIFLIAYKKFSFFQYKVSPFVATALLIQDASLILSVLHWATYANSGEGVVGEGNWLRELGVCVLIAVILMGSAGWTTTTISALQPTPRKVFIAFMVLIPCLYVVLLIWAIAVRNQWWFVDYLYETVPGAILMAVRMIAGLWFMYSLRQTMFRETNVDKNRIYFQFGAVAFAWMMIVPIFSYIGFAIVSYYQMKVMTGIMLSCDTLCIIAILIILRPSVVETYFTTAGQVSQSLSIPPATIAPVPAAAPPSSLQDTLLGQTADDNL